jgi:hypothetical protein
MADRNAPVLGAAHSRSGPLRRERGRAGCVKLQGVYVLLVDDRVDLHVLSRVACWGRMGLQDLAKCQ